MSDTGGDYDMPSISIACAGGQEGGGGRTRGGGGGGRDMAKELARAINATGVQTIANPCFVPAFYLTSAGTAVSATPAGASLFPATNATIKSAYVWYTLQNGPVRRLITSTLVSGTAYVTHLTNQACGSIQ